MMVPPEKEGHATPGQAEASIRLGVEISPTLAVKMTTQDFVCLPFIVCIVVDVC
jgi:hypothetical protein